MLTLYGGTFTCGRSRFSDSAPHWYEPTAKIFVRLRIGSVQQVLAQLDTGAAWSVLAPDVADEACIPIESGDPALLSTRFGVKKGYLVRTGFSLVADEGEPLHAEGQFFICQDWPEGLNFLGYSGLLEFIRFALDPQANHFYFGPGI
ncbi:MAG TPA: hypothetical protein VGP73_23875 [Thermoanaerobaculia bacterium]